MNDDNLSSLPHTLSLGKTVAYPTHYDPRLLSAVPRSMARNSLGIDNNTLPFSGADLWTGFELSWLNTKGKPVVAILQCAVPVSSPNLIESKSFKLYLNSFNQTRFTSLGEVEEKLHYDLSRCAGTQITLKIISYEDFPKLAMEELQGTLIDDIDIEINDYQPNPNLLKTNKTYTEETLVSHLLKSNCLITNQPDWASISIRYAGNQIDAPSLLRYLISFREHNEFHEQCVERIFTDIQRLCSPKKLSVYARYTRRGGLDINPFRSNFEDVPENIRHARQ